MPLNYCVGPAPYGYSVSTMVFLSNGVLASRPSSSLLVKARLKLLLSVSRPIRILGRIAQDYHQCPYRTLDSQSHRLLLLFGVPGQPPFWKPSFKFHPQGS